MMSLSQNRKTHPLQSKSSKPNQHQHHSTLTMLSAHLAFPPVHTPHRRNATTIA